MIVALSFCETRRISPCVARKGKSGTYPTSPHKAHTGDLSRFVSHVSVNNNNCTKRLWLEPFFDRLAVGEPN